jgi:uncharacterized protein
MSESREQVDLETRVASLRSRVRALGSVLVCFSGGLDSALVLAVAHRELGERAVGLTATGPALAPSEREQAEAFARRIGARHELVDAGEIERAGYVANGPDRCLHCKSSLYAAAKQAAARLGLAAIANGTNLDDLGDYRPGLEAARDAGVVSPLLECGFRKADVRAAARSMGLAVWDKPASACLASRIPYGTPVTRERLEQVARFEQSLRDLGLRTVRVRHHESIARLEVDAADLGRVAASPLREAVLEAGKRAGFLYVALDLGGYRTGSHNEALSRARRLPVAG